MSLPIRPGPNRLDVNSGSSDLHVFDAGPLFDSDLGEEVYEDDGGWAGADGEGGGGLQSVAGDVGVETWWIRNMRLAPVRRWAS